MLRLAVLTQADEFAIPMNIVRLGGVPGAFVTCVVELDVKSALGNRLRFFVRGFGVRQAARMFVTKFTYGFMDAADRVLGCRVFRRPHSIQAAARRIGADFLREYEPNSDRFLSELRKRQVDLVVSFSAPCVFREPLLRLPRHGCINLHCSLLPEFAGILPSFWVLYHRAKEAGATVHYMDDKIDNGAILAQTRFPLPPKATMLQIIRQTKLAGGALMEDVVRSMAAGRVPNTIERSGAGCYFSWPTIDQMREFRRKGGRLI